MISAALKMCRTAVNQTMHASKRRIFCLSEGELYICEKEAERCAFRFFCFCFGHCRRSGTRRKLVFVVASPKPNACCKRSALVHFRSLTLAANGFRWRISKVRPHPGSLRSHTFPSSGEGLPHTRCSRCGRSADAHPHSADLPFSMRFRYCPVYDRSQAATSSGVPVQTISPPPSPPSGPRSMM